MTSGALDWQGYAQWQGSNLLEAWAQDLAAGANKSGPLQVDPWRGVQVIVDLTAVGYGTATLSWYTDSTESTLIWQDQWSVSAAMELIVTVPQRAPVVDLNINITSGGSATANTLLAGTNLAGPSVTYPVTNDVIANTGLSIPSSDTIYQPFPTLQPGLAVVTLNPNDGTGHLEFDIVTLTPAGLRDKYVARFGSPTSTTPVIQTIGLPDQWCGWQIENSDAAGAHTCNLYAVLGCGHA
jgi:hypothetical protein